MSIGFIATIKRWQGTFADKPETDVPEGSTYHVIDTGECLIYHDGGWEKDFRLARAIKDAELLPQL